MLEITSLTPENIERIGQNASLEIVTQKLNEVDIFGKRLTASILGRLASTKSRTELGLRLEEIAVELGIDIKGLSRDIADYKPKQGALVITLSQLGNPLIEVKRNDPWDNEKVLGKIYVDVLISGKGEEVTSENILPLYLYDKVQALIKDHVAKRSSLVLFEYFRSVGRVSNKVGSFIERVLGKIVSSSSSFDIEVLRYLEDHNGPFVNKAFEALLRANWDKAIDNHSYVDGSILEGFDYYTGKYLGLCLIHRNNETKGVEEWKYSVLSDPRLQTVTENIIFFNQRKAFEYRREAIKIVEKNKRLLFRVLSFVVGE